MKSSLSFEHERSIRNQYVDGSTQVTLSIAAAFHLLQSMYAKQSATEIVGRCWLHAEVIGR